MSAIPPRDRRMRRRCPNCTADVKAYDEHWQDGDEPFVCEFMSPRPASYDEKMEIRHLRWAFDQIVDDPEWDKIIDEWIDEARRQDPPLNWWERVVAVVVITPVLLGTLAYGWLDDKLRKRGL